jgi:uncharacterized protein
MRRTLREFTLLVTAALLFGLGIYWLQSPSPKQRTLRLTAGDATGLRHKLALELAKEAKRVGIELRVEATPGSEVALTSVNGGKFDLALIQGGLSGQRMTSVRQVSALHVEPLHLLVNPSTHQAIEALGLAGLVGRNVNLGPVGSGTRKLAEMVLSMAGLRAAQSPGESEYYPMSLSYSELMASPGPQLPEAVFTVSSLPASIADFLVDEHRYRLVPLRFGEAIALSAFSELDAPLADGAIDKRHIHNATIPAFTYSIARSEPPESIATLGTRVLLVSNARVNDEAIERLLDALFHANFARATRPPLEGKLLELAPEFPLHFGSLKYLQRSKPLIAGDAVDYVEKMLAIIATVVGGLFFAIQWSLRSRQRRREAVLAKYMERVISIESSMFHNEVAAELDLAELIRLQRELGELKAQAVRKFAVGELEGEGMIQGFLALVNDARNQLTRLILHQRENIEQFASRQRVSPDAVWTAQAQNKHPEN